MDYNINSVKSSVQSFSVPHISNKKSNSRIAMEFLCHFPLFHLVTREYYNFFWVIFV